MRELCALSSLLDRELAPHRNAKRWWLAYSGGVDSSVLLHLLVAYRRRHPASPPIHAVHINHQLQEAAGDWVAHCRHQCEALAVPLAVKSVEVDTEKASLEAAAREARYAFFESIVGEDEVLLLAHHLDDQLETFFLRALRGAGVSGLSGMPATRSVGKGVLLRPLLAASRKSIQDYRLGQAITAVDDPSNHSAQFDRSYLRTEVLPLLEARWPAYRQTVSRAMGHLRALEPQVLDYEMCYSVTGDRGISLMAMETSSDAQVAGSLRAWLRSEGLSMPDAKALGEFVRQLRQNTASRARLQTSAWCLQRYDGAVYRLPEIKGGRENTRLSPGEPCQWGDGELVLVPCVEGEIGVLSQAILTVKPRRGGERCKLLGHKIHRPVKKVLQDLRVPPWWREQLPLLYAGDELIAIADLRWCDSSLIGKTLPGERRFRLHWRREN